MRNLKIIRRLTVRQPAAGGRIVTAFDNVNDALLCSYGPSEASSAIELRRLSRDERDEGTTLASWDAPCPIPTLPCDHVLSLQYFADTATACLVFAGGDIVIVREDPLPIEDKIEIVGSVDAGIAAAAWAHDEELLAICTNADTLLFMTRDFEAVTSINFSEDDLKASRHVSVGWGKAETQFKGKRAKALRDPTMPEKVDEGRLSPSDSGDATISWRGDGAFVAVNTVHAQQRRIIRVYSREGSLDSVSEPVNGLEGALSWRPAGNLVAGVQRFEERVDIVFFERNGLRHGQFSLRLTPDELSSWGKSIRLKWNSDSSVLAVSFLDRFQLWTMGNYHWYLKQEIVLDAGSPSQVEPVAVAWSSEKPLQLVANRDGVVQRLDLIQDVSGCPPVPPDDLGTVAVIDGTLLKLTPLRVANVPPPMSVHDITVNGNIVDVALTTDHVAILQSSAVDVYAYSGSEPRFLSSYPIKEGRQICFHESTPMVLGDQVIWYLSDWTNVLPYPPSAEVCRLFSTLEPNAAAMCWDGSLYRCQMNHARFEPIGKNPAVLPWVQSDGSNTYGLASNGFLYANERCIAHNCTSFALTLGHLIFTTSQHLLKFVHLGGGELEVPPDEPEKDERCRTIERGARIVAVMPTSYAVTLQMPRGNLETVYPRALVLAGIRKSIAGLDYKTAFLACRNHRVDMNILHDYTPEQFLANVALFIKQVKKVEHIDLFLSQLKEEDVSLSLYKDTLPANGVDGAAAIEPHTTRQPVLGAGGPSKVNRICDAFLSVLHNSTTTNLQNIITANVCKSPPDLEAGLKVVAELRKQGTELAERAAEHICFLADVNQLYDHALGLYDLELALLIAQQSQKDPQEYLPYLQSLQAMPELRTKFTIDDHLGRRRKALQHLHKLNSFDEFKVYVEKHELYGQALELYRYEIERLNVLMRLHADYLSSRNKFKEAGLEYEYLSDHASATQAYLSANMWRECLASATLVPLPATEIQSLASSLADGAVESKDFLSAATIRLDYLSDVEDAARTLCKGYFFGEAMRLLGLHCRRDLLESVIDAGLIEGFASMTELLADCKSQLGAQVPRLRELRRKKAEDPLSFFEGADSTDIPDNVSLAPTDTSTSGGTLFTRYTNRTGTINTQTTRKTSKNRRREERKRARGKKGSIYEEEYLVASIGRLIERVNSVGEEVHRLVEGLIRRGMRERALAVEQAMVGVVEMCKACVGEVFLVEEKREEGEAIGEENRERPGGADGVLWDSLEERGKKRAAPLIKEFERLSLLGC